MYLSTHLPSAYTHTLFYKFLILFNVRPLCLCAFMTSRIKVCKLTSFLEYAKSGASWYLAAWHLERNSRILYGRSTSGLCTASWLILGDLRLTSNQSDAQNSPMKLKNIKSNACLIENYTCSVPLFHKNCSYSTARIAAAHWVFADEIKSSFW